MLQIFTVAFKTLIGTVTIVCGIPFSEVPMIDPINLNVGYACMIEIDNERFMATGQLIRLSDEAVPKLILPGDQS